MRIFIAPRVGTGTRRDAFRPEVAVAEVGGRLGSHALPDGSFLCVAPRATSAPRGTVDLGDDPAARLTGGRSAALAEKLGAVDGLTIGEALLLGDSKTTPTRAGRVKVTIAGVAMYDAPTIRGGATDSFTYSDGALPTVSSAAWTAVDGQINVVSGQITRTTSSDLAVCRHTAAYSTDHYSQLAITPSSPSSNNEWGVWTRMTGASETGYYAFFMPSAGIVLYSVDAAEYTQLDVEASGGSTGGTMRLESDGSNHTVFVDTVETLSASDSTLTAGTYVGVGGWQLDTSQWFGDNWEGGDLAPPPPPAAFEQQAYRFRNDDGDEDGATWIEAENTAADVELDTTYRVRVGVAVVDAAADGSVLTLEYVEDGGSDWRAIGLGATGSPPTITSATPTSDDTAGTTVAANYPATVAAGDLLIFVVAKDDDATGITDTTGGLNVIRNGNTGSGTDGVCLFAGWMIAAGSEDGGTRTFTGDSEEWSVQCIRILAGEFDASNPIDSAAELNGATTGEAITAAFTCDRAGGLVIACGAVDVDPMDATFSPTGWTDVADTDSGNVASWVSRRDAATTAGETIAATTFGINASDANVALAFVVSAPRGTPAVVTATSSNYADGDATTEQLAATGTFAAGVMVEASATADAIATFAEDSDTEVEWAFEVQSPAEATDVFDFRVTLNGAPLDTYTVTPSLTVASGDTGQDITPAGATVSVTPGTPSFDLNVAPTGASVSVTPGTVAVTTGVAPAGPTITVTPGTLTVTVDQDVAPAGPTITVTPGTLSVDLNVAPAGATVSVTAGTPTVEPGAAAITPTGATVSVTPGTATVSSVLYPASISGRKLLDQNGDVYLYPTMSSWGMTTQLTDTEITSALEAIAALGFRGVTVWMGGGYNGGGLDDWNLFTTAEHGDLWTGTPWATSLGPGWAATDWIVAEAFRLGIVVTLSITNSSGGWGGATTGQMEAAGVAVATRYATYPNIVWHIMLDDDTAPGSGDGQKAQAFYEGVNDTEGASTRPVRWMEVENGSTTDDQGWFEVGEFNCSVNCAYDYGDESVEIFEDVWAETSAPTGDCEPPYVGAPHYSGNEYQQVRERNFATFIEGGCLINFGHEDWWPFTAEGLYTEGLDWDEVPASTALVQSSYCWAFIDTHLKDVTFAPTSSFVTTGEGSGDTKAAQGAGDAIAVAYFPSNRTVAVDTTILDGTGNVRLRWFDPTDGTYTSISASEAQQTGRSVTIPAAHGDGSRDWVLVVDLTDDLSVTPTGATVSVTPGTVGLDLNVTPTGATVTVAPGTLSVDLNVAPAGASVAVTAGTLTVDTGAVDITPTGATVTVTPGTATVTQGLSLVPDGAPVSVTPGTLELDLNVTPTGATVTATPGSLLVANVQTIAPDGATVSVTPGTVEVVVGGTSITPVGATVSVTPGTATVDAGAVAITPTGPTVTITAGTLTVDLGTTLVGPTVSVTPGTLVVTDAGNVTPTGATVTITAGTLVVTAHALVLPETHLYTVPAESHTYTVPAESHTFTVRAGS